MSRLELAHVLSDGGHRLNYLALLSGIFGLQPEIGPLDRDVRARLIGARRLLIATIDDATTGYIEIMARRSALGRPTAGLLLRPQSCFTAGNLHALAKRITLAATSRIPGASMLTITPFEICPHYAQIARAGTFDPEYWDWPTPPPAATPLGANLRALAGGRPIVVLVGSISAQKGFDFFAACATELQADFCFVAAGTVQPGSREIAAGFVDAGGVLIDQHLADEDFLSLVAHTDLVWACYSPAYDQASGLFGRSLQLGRPVVVRAGSLLQRFAAAYGSRSTLPVAFGTPPSAETLRTLIQNPRADPPEERRARSAAWRRHFQDTVGAALTGTLR